MTIDLATAYDKTGLTESAENDALLQATMDTTLAILENYLDRKLEYATETDSFYYTHRHSLDLDRYPVETIDSITSEGDAVNEYKVKATAGEMLLPRNVISKEVDVTYTGGYETFPADLETAYWLTFLQVYNTTEGGGTTVNVNGISSITIPDVGTIRYDTSSSSSSSSGTSSSVPGHAFIPELALAILGAYRRLSC